MRKLNALFLEAENEINILTLRTFQRLGEECVTRIRDRDGDDSWYDDSGNLRSSVGYAISHNGIIVSMSEFTQVKDGSEGTMTGKALAEKLAKEGNYEWQLVIVAGMNYAVYVEAMKNKDVLASTDLWVRERAPRLIEQLKRQIAR